MKTRVAACLFLAGVMTFAGCGMPADPADSFARMRDTGVLRAGIAPREPWTSATGGGGPEADLITAFAQAHGARVEWRRGSDAELFESLERFELDVAVGGFTHDNPWGPKLGMTRPYAEAQGKKHVIAVAPGENRLLLEIERALRAHAPAIAARTGARPLS